MNLDTLLVKCLVVKFECFKKIFEADNWNDWSVRLIIM